MKHRILPATAGILLVVPVVGAIAADKGHAHRVVHQVIHRNIGRAEKPGWLAGDGLHPSSDL